MEGYLAFLQGDRLEHFATPLRADGSYDLPAMLALLRRFRGRVALSMLEEQIAMPEQDPSSTLKIGRGIGLWEMGLVAAELPYETEDPSTWKGEMGILVPRAKSGTRPKPPAAFGELNRNEVRRRVSTLKRRKKDEGYEPTPDEQALIDFLRANGDRSAERKKAAKALSEGKATALFPGYDFRASPRCTTLHDGKTESALLAVVGRRRYLGARGR